ncbi:MAG: hypothetical protein PHY93_10850 [Bacteriovorax sp.]|nr:hypothetical protein [Bacteriovorax sp.]
MSEPTHGIPKLSKENIDPISYVPIKANKLKDARVVWLNFDLLREKGIEIPREGVTPEFEQRLLDQFAYMVKSDHDNADDFLPEEKTLYADRYGGYGLGVNWGSGRAASSGEYQVKGSGQTPLVGDGQTFDHAHGGASFKESIQEAIWGEVNQQELPLGSNRVLMIIDSGTDTSWSDGTKEPRAMIVREDPLRPAHYLEAFAGNGPWREIDNERVHKNFLNFLKSIPLPANVDRSKLAKEDIVKQGLEEFIDRIAQQFAAANARRVYHGAISASNIDLSGKFLDFGTETTLSDFGKAEVLSHSKSFDQEVMDHVEQTLFPLLSMVQKELKDHSEKLPARYQLHNLVEDKFKYYQKIEFLNLLGTPDHLNRKFIENSYANDLAESMVKIAFSSSSAKTYSVDKEMPERMGTYPSSEIFRILGATKSTDPLKLENEIGEKLPEDLRKELSVNYSNYIKFITKEAENESISHEAFFQYKLAQSLIKNRDIPELYRSNLHAANIKLIDQFKQDGDRSKIWKSIDKKITNSRMTYKELAPYQVTLNSEYNKLSGEVRYLIFDAKKNQHIIKIISPLRQNQFGFYNNRIHIISNNDIPIIRYTENNWSTHHEVKGRAVNENIEFELPINDNTSHVELAMRSSDGSSWWKNGDGNGIFNIGRHVNAYNSSKDCRSLLKLFIQE